MNDYKVKSKKKESKIEKLKEAVFRHSNYLLLFLALVFSISAVRNIIKISQARTNLTKVREKVEKLKKDNTELEDRLKEMKSQEYVEKQIRDKLGLAKPGEIVVIMPEEEVLRKLSPRIPTEEDVLPDPTWKRWLKLFL